MEKGRGPGKGSQTSRVLARVALPCPAEDSASGLANYRQKSCRFSTPILMGHWLRADSGVRQISRDLIFSIAHKQ